jgi:tetratricopeptide (TPR) repeat protein
MMADPVRRTAAPLPTASASEFVGTFAVVLVAILLLLFVDEWLARVDRDESRAHAASLYADGQQLLAAGQPGAAGERIASALAIERTNDRYARGLAEARLANNQPAAAAEALQPVLQHAATDGAANLLMARALVREGRPREAKSYYHRAIYGQWHGDSLAQRMVTRFELISLLARENAQGELLAELLPIQDARPDSLPLRRRLGHLFIQAGSPARGVEILREVLRQSPNDGDAYAGMGEAALALGHFRTARADLVLASRLLPGDTAILSRLALADTALALDPMQRGIGRQERTTRSRRLLTMIVDLRARCQATGSAPAPALVDSARRLLQEASTHRDEESRTDDMLSLSADLLPRAAECGASASIAERALTLLQGRLGG